MLLSKTPRRPSRYHTIVAAPPGERFCRTSLSVEQYEALFQQWRAGLVSTDAILCEHGQEVMDLIQLPWASRDLIIGSLRALGP